MEKRAENLFDRVRHEEPSSGLYSRIMDRIEAHVRRMRLFKLSFLYPAALVSAFFAFFALQYAAAEFSASGFFDYASLLVSDSGTVLSAWKEFALLLAESLPLFGITLFLASLFAFLASVRFIAKYLKTALSSARLA